jgi:hypothetical protein
MDEEKLILRLPEKVNPPSFLFYVNLVDFLLSSQLATFKTMARISEHSDN